MARFLSFVCCWATFLPLLAGCQPALLRDETSPLFVVPVGSTLILHEPVEIPTNAKRVFFQRGRVRDFEATNLFYPHCVLVTKPAAATDSHITAGRFKVVEVRRDFDDTQYYRHRLYAGAFARLASASAGLASGDGRVFELMFTTEMTLESVAQPQVQSLNCQQLDNATLGNHVTIRQIRRALGASASLQLPRREEASRLHAPGPALTLWRVSVSFDHSHAK